MIAPGDMVQLVGDNHYCHRVYIILEYLRNSQVYDMYCLDTGSIVWDNAGRLNDPEHYRKLA